VSHLPIPPIISRSTLRPHPRGHLLTCYWEESSNGQFFAHFIQVLNPTDDQIEQASGAVRATWSTNGERPNRRPR
jgi:hypothetical protein